MAYSPLYAAPLSRFSAFPHPPTRLATSSVRQNQLRRLFDVLEVLVGGPHSDRREQQARRAFKVLASQPDWDMAQLAPLGLRLADWSSSGEQDEGDKAAGWAKDSLAQIALVAKKRQRAKTVINRADRTAMDENEACAAMHEYVLRLVQLDQDDVALSFLQTHLGTMPYSHSPPLLSIAGMLSLSLCDPSVPSSSSSTSKTPTVSLLRAAQSANPTNYVQARDFFRRASKEEAKASRRAEQVDNDSNLQLSGEPDRWLELMEKALPNKGRGNSSSEEEGVASDAQPPKKRKKQKRPREDGKERKKKSKEKKAT